MECTPKQRPLITFINNQQFQQSGRNKFNFKKSIFSIKYKKKHTERKIRDIFLFIIVSKKIKYVLISLVMEFNHFNENLTSLNKQIEKHTKKKMERHLGWYIE